MTRARTQYQTEHTKFYCYLCAQTNPTLNQFARNSDCGYKSSHRTVADVGRHIVYTRVEKTGELLTSLYTVYTRVEKTDELLTSLYTAYTMVENR
jgi:hypothetical protein